MHCLLSPGLQVIRCTLNINWVKVKNLIPPTNTLADTSAMMADRSVVCWCCVYPRVSWGVGRRDGGIGFFTFINNCHKVYLIVMLVLGLGFVFGLFLGLRLLFLFACWVKLERHFMTVVVRIPPPQYWSWCNPGHICAFYTDFILLKFFVFSRALTYCWK